MASVRSAGPRLALLLCGDADAWDADELGEFRERYRDILAVRHLMCRERPGALVDEESGALEVLEVNGASSAPIVATAKGATPRRSISATALVTRSRAGSGSHSSSYAATSPRPT